MTLRDWNSSIRLSRSPVSTRALLMAAMRQGDAYTFECLAIAFPEVLEELETRRNSKHGGWIDGDPPYLKPVAKVEAAEFPGPPSAKPASLAVLHRARREHANGEASESSG